MASEHAAQANGACPECGGELRPLDGADDLRECRDCGHRLHPIAAEHHDLLEDLRDDGDDAIATAAETILAYGGGEPGE